MRSLKSRRLKFAALIALCLAGAVTKGPVADARADRHYLYVATPGIRNYVEYGGIGLIVYDMDNGHRFVKRYPTFDLAPGDAPENVKGIAASGKTGRVYVSTLKRVGAFDAATSQRIWVKEYEGGADRLALSPDGKVFYLPSFEGPHWTAIDAMSGEVIKKLVLNSGAHNTIYGADGKHVYLAGLSLRRISSRSMAICRSVTFGKYGPRNHGDQETRCSRASALSSRAPPRRSSRPRATNSVVITSTGRG